MNKNTPTPTHEPSTADTTLDPRSCYGTGPPDRAAKVLDGTERYLTKEQAAVYLNVTPRFIRRLVEERRVKVTKVGRYNRFTPTDLEAFIHREASPPPTAQKQALEEDEATDPILRAATQSRNPDAPSRNGLRREEKAA